MKTLKTVSILAAFAVLTLAGLLPAFTAQDAKTAVAETEDPDVVLHVKGLACENCARSLESALLEVDGIDAVEVFLEGDQRVHLQLADGATVDEETLRTAVEGCGFVLEEVSFKRSGGSQ